MNIYEEIARKAGFDFDSDGDGVRSASGTQWTENWENACHIIAEFYSLHAAFAEYWSDVQKRAEANDQG